MKKLLNPLKNSIGVVLTALVLINALPAQAGKLTFYYHDAMGSPIAATDESGEVVWTERHEAFGETKLNQPEKEKHRIGYTGHAFDRDIGLVYMGHRYYDPKIGRFMSIDPVGFTPGNVQSFNRYAYANNNPYRFIDPDGRYADLAVEAVSIGIGLHSFSENWNMGNYGAASLDGLGIVGDGILAAVPGLPGGIGLGIKAWREGSEQALKNVVTKGTPKITTPYKRPSGATTKAQRESVQGKPCVDCGTKTSKQYADHKDPLVKEYYRTGTIDKARMRDVDSVQPQCPTCSNKQGAEMSRFSRQQKKDLGL